MLITDDMQRMVDAVCRRASQQGFILPNEICAELANAGMPEARWPDVVSLAGCLLTRRDGRYYHSDTNLPSEDELHGQRRLHRTVRRIIGDYRLSARHERRHRGRIDFVRPVKVETEDGRCFMLLTSNLSSSGIRLIGPTSLLGQKLRVSLASDEGTTPTCFSVQVVWSTVVSEGLFENGGAFLGVVSCQSTRPGDAPHAT
jgi:PilZ domain